MVAFLKNTTRACILQQEAASRQEQNVTTRAMVRLADCPRWEEGENGVQMRTVKWSVLVSCNTKVIIRNTFQDRINEQK